MFYASRDVDCHTCLNEVKRKSCEYARIIWCITISIHLRFLNKGAIMRDGDINDEGSARNSWEICSIQQIEEVKCLVIILPICFSGILCSL